MGDCMDSSILSAVLPRAGSASSHGDGEDDVEKASFAGLIQNELPKLQNYARMLMRDEEHASDLVQDTIVRVLTYADQWQPGTNFGAWVKTIMRNYFYTECVRRTREAKVCIQDADADQSTDAAQDERLACKELTDAIRLLPRNQRTAVTLAGLHGLRSEEIAARMQISPNAVRCHLTRARKTLRCIYG